jgi:hypothetical protein
MTPGGCGCKGHFFKMCAKCAEIKPYMVYRPNEGYFWGPGYPIESEKGKRPYWSTSPKKENDNYETPI